MGPLKRLSAQLLLAEGHKVPQMHRLTFHLNLLRYSDQNVI